MQFIFTAAKLVLLAEIKLPLIDLILKILPLVLAMHLNSVLKDTYSVMTASTNECNSNLIASCF